MECKGLMEICCDYAVCVTALSEMFGVEADPVEVAKWISDNLVDMQGDCEECPAKIKER